MPRSVPKFLVETVERLPDKLAISSRARAVTFSELYHEALSTAECLRELGIGPGDRVGVCMEKSVDQVSTILGILFANAMVVPILPRLKRPNILHIIENSGMAAMITDSNRLKEVKEFSHLTKLLTGHGEVDEDWPNLAYMRKYIQPRYFFDRIGADSAAIIYSSGSTGRPKGILISHRNLADGADIVAEYLGTVEDDRIACILSFNFDYGLNQIWQILRTGATLYLHDLALPNDLFILLAGERITGLPVMPVILSQMFDKRLKTSADTLDFSSLRYVCSTGGRLSSDMIHDLRRTFPDTKVYSMFGLTEAFRGTYLDPEKLATHPKSIGKSIPGCEVMVLDEQGNECAPMEVGELVQRGATVTKGYWRDPDNTARVFRAHPRWPGETLVFSGDSAYRDEDGFLYFVGRRDEMIKTKGFRVSPTEVESEVTNFPDVSAALAFAIPNISVGEDIGCAYTTEDGKPIQEHQLKRYLRVNLPSHMVPTQFLHFDHFPITGNAGKFDRKSIKTAAYERLGIKLGDTPPVQN
jgi:amino acid adenylation domain-containing protein